MPCCVTWCLSLSWCFAVMLLCVIWTLLFACTIELWFAHSGLPFRFGLRVSGTSGSGFHVLFLVGLCFSYVCLWYCFTFVLLLALLLVFSVGVYLWFTSLALGLICFVLFCFCYTLRTVVVWLLVLLCFDCILCVCWLWWFIVDCWVLITLICLLYRLCLFVLFMLVWFCVQWSGWFVYFLEFGFV